MSNSSQTKEPCSECDKVRLEHTLNDEEALRASTRDLAKLDKQHQFTLEETERGKQLDAEEAIRASERAIAKLEKEQQQAQETAQEAVLATIQENELQAEAQLGKLFHENISEVAKGSIERSRDSAKYVQTAAAAIAALYTGALGLVFSVTNNPLPIRGIAATVFLGLSVALSTAYLAYITKPVSLGMYPGGASLSELQLNRTAFLAEWVNAIVNDRRWAVRASVLSLAIGVTFIPAAFLSTHHPPSIPAAPTAPTIPAQIAPEIAPEAKKLFNAEAASYESAEKARAKLIEATAGEASTVAKDERSANWTTLGLGILGLLVVLLGPFARKNQ
jgi:hypothetical protein